MPRRETHENPHPVVPRIPRSLWKWHENYPDQVLLLGSHANFRRVSSYLAQEAQSSWKSAPDAPPRADLLDLFTRWKGAMRNHEGYEEGKLYPYLHARYGVSLEFLESHHRQLKVAEQSVHAAYDDQDAEEVAVCFARHDEILVPHLAQEEDTVIPLLLNMQRSEFDHYGHSGIATLLNELAQQRSKEAHKSNG